MTRKPRVRVPLWHLLDGPLLARAALLPTKLELWIGLSEASSRLVTRLVGACLETPIWQDDGRDYATTLFVRELLDAFFDVDRLATADVTLAVLRALTSDEI